jgi:uncharacterized membrane protein YcaP (DUF421 family)
VWHSVFHLGTSVGEKVVRSLLVYLFLIAALRFLGKRELGQSNTLDLVVLLLVANAVQNGIIGDDVSVTGAVIGAAVLFGVNETLTRAGDRLPWFQRVLEGTPTVLIEHGKLRRKALRSAGISPMELRSIARRQGFADLGDVHTAILETNGVVTMFRQDEPDAELREELGLGR